MAEEPTADAARVTNGTDQNHVPPKDRVRHYPLDCPSLPFDRYDHRRITARDIMVHRIMTDYMRPTRILPSTYKNKMTDRVDFGPVKEQDEELGLDMQVLRKMLFTSHFLDTHWKALSRKNVARPTKSAEEVEFASLGDQILDLVERHYLEIDDSSLRTWIAKARPPRIPAGPRTANEPRSKTSMSGETRGDAVRELTDLIERQRKRDGKKWEDEDTKHLRSLQAQVNTQEKLQLYDGGVSVPHLKQLMDSCLVRAKGARHGLNRDHWTITRANSPYLPLPMWPEDTPPRMYLHTTIVDVAAQTRTAMKTGRGLSLPTVDFNLNPGRGRDRDGWWTTGQGLVKIPELPIATLDGRFSRCRRRCCSEPPPIFKLVNFPLTAKEVGSVMLEMTVPARKLSTLDRRSRRRSLSRTRIEEQFDWDVTISPDTFHAGRSRVDKKDSAKHPKRCENCHQPDHQTFQCRSPCGHCGAPGPLASKKSSLLPPGYDFTSAEPQSDDGEDWGPSSGVHQSPHLAPQCPVARRNRCKCVSFPTFHVAAHCPVTCSRNCGNTAPRGSFRHKNAMLCRSRCCMCGLRGHSGRECRQRKCRCKRAHLGQDCGWKPECCVPGCDRYWCGVHCRECGTTQKPFLEWRCAKCTPDSAAFEQYVASLQNASQPQADVTAGGGQEQEHGHALDHGHGQEQELTAPVAVPGVVESEVDGDSRVENKPNKGKSKLSPPSKKGDGATERQRPVSERSIFGPVERIKDSRPR